MRPDKSRWTLAASAPLALAAVLAAAPQAGAGVGGAAVSSPHVAADGTLTVEFTSAVSDQAADAAEARNVAASFVGEWAGQLIDEAARNNPPHAAATCRANATATDPNGATGTASADVPTGLNDTRLVIPDQAPRTKWGVGDLDHFTVELVCTDTGTGGSVSRAVIDQDETAV
jgi:hypothetical protein